MDRIEDENGPVMADHVLAVLRRLMSWHASRDDDFRSPIVRGMARTKPKERARKRTLGDEEIRALWKCADAAGTAYARMLQCILLTAARIKEASRMNRAERCGDGEWTIPAARHKSQYLLGADVEQLNDTVGVRRDDGEVGAVEYGVLQDFGPDRRRIVTRPFDV